MKTQLIILLTFVVIKTSFGQGFWNKTVTVGSDGVMEIGKYIDFHETNSDPNDYCFRISSINNALNFSGSLNVGGNLTLSTGLIRTNTLLLNDPNSTDNWNNLWQCGFYQSLDKSTAPESTGWFWGINMGHSSNTTDYRYNGQIAIKNSPTSPTMYFRSTNSIGEGDWAKVLTNQGNQKITGDLTLAGKILCREVKVTLDAGADFVFDKDYKLTDLEEIENFINNNKHLPNIESEEKMIQEGINIKEFQIKLLQKIEELTLYTIEQNKKIMELQEIIDRNGLK